MTHIVEYEGWCQKCKFAKADEETYPCCECLAEPVKEDGKRPVYWTQDPKQKEKEKKNARRN